MTGVQTCALPNYQMMYADWTGEEYDTEKSLPTYEQMEKEFHQEEKQAMIHEENHHHECGCGCSEDGCNDHDCDCNH